MKPKQIQIFPSGELGLLWEDGHESLYLAQELRKHCPCARCQEGVQNTTSVDLGQNTIKEVFHVGHYALSIRWVDGHDTGIYTFDFLRQLCPCEKCKTKSV